MRLKNKVAIITGGARGIGKAISELFAKEGARVIIWDLLDEGTETAATINANGGQAEFLKISVTDEAQVTANIDAVAKKYGRIDILINNAGITRDRTLGKMTTQEWQQVLDVNLTGVFLCTRAVIPYMKAQKYGHIVSAASNVAHGGNFGQTNYSATKAGVIAMSKTWALELGKYGITANAVAPGFTLTPMTEKIPKEIMDKMLPMIPLRKVAQPIDIAYGYLYLASDESSFVSGICLTIDGGATRH